MPIYILYFIIFVEGFVSIAIEILAIRQLLPFVGSNVIVTSLIIGIFLLFLALGYRRGGAHRGNYRQVLLNNFSAAAILVGLGLSYTCVNAYFVLVQRFISQNVLFILTAYLLLIIAPSVYILGQTVPITTNYFSKFRVSVINATVMYLSTLGSFLGATLTSLVLFHFFGVATTLVITYGLLLALILVLAQVKDWFRILTLLFIGVIVYHFNINYEKTFMIGTTPYGNYQVVDVDWKGGSGKALVINRSFSSYMDKKGNVATYIQATRRYLFEDLKLRNKTILVLGAGGFTLGVGGDYNNHLIYVDIEPKLKDIVKKHFNPNPTGQFIVADARQYLLRSTRQYDVIFSDAYTHRAAMPAYLATQEYFMTVKQHLMPQGLAVFNIIADPTFKERYARRIDNTLRYVFGYCANIPLQFGKPLSNMIYLCYKHEGAPSREIYRDDLNKATVDAFESNVN